MGIADETNFQGNSHSEFPVLPRAGEIENCEDAQNQKREPNLLLESRAGVYAGYQNLTGCLDDLSGRL
jgi:hypothetical protein